METKLTSTGSYMEERNIRKKKQEPERNEINSITGTGLKREKNKEERKLYGIAL